MSGSIRPFPSDTPARRFAADVLILGGGLAGLRAALAALERAPGLRVLVATLSPGPAGSSFANRNDALGIHVPLTDQEREDYTREVAALNRGAWLDPHLLAIQAEEAAARLADLVDIGLGFQRNADGGLRAHTSCFSPASHRAYVFRGLGAAWRCFKARLDALGGSFLTGVSVADVRGGNRPGALLLAGGGACIQVDAGSVVVALGGPARLFGHTMCGPGSQGYGHGLLAEAGARMVNCGFMQFMWASEPGKRFWQPGDWSEADPLLASQRREHCPFGYGLPDAAIDRALAARLDCDGCTEADGQRVAPMAHASNGGAAIDAWGRTSVPGLLACGECATGMHGANRIGGGMVLATQVFGRRAGLAAAEAALAAQVVTGEPWPEPVTDTEERREGLRWLARGLSRHAVLGGLDGVEAFRREAGSRLQSAHDWKLRLALRAAGLILEQMPSDAEPPV